jgi:N-acetylmuramoyl-L-alanine amidase
LNTVTKFLASLVCLSAAAIVAQTAAPSVAKAPLPHHPAVAKPVAPKAASTATKPATTTPSPGTALPFNRGIIVLDGAHGGVDTGARITDSILEKNVTLSFAFKLRSLLAARGFTVVMTRDADTSTEADSPIAPLSLDDRAGLANHSHPLACLLLHATASGSGVHLYSSELDVLPSQPLANPWLTAQAAWVTQSQMLEKSIGQAITRSGSPLVMSRASVRPMDSLTCPALVVELAPNGGDAASVNDADYQQRIAGAIAGAMIQWKTQAQPPSAAAAAPSLAAPTGVMP